MAGCDCSCNAAPKLIFACSGAADVGALSDQAARSMTAQGAGKMFCLAGIGGRVPGIMKTTEAASDILAIDGCGLKCVAESLKQAGFDNFKHMVLTDMGYEKGGTEVCNETVAKVAAAGSEMLK